MSKEEYEFKDNSQAKHLLQTFDYFDYFMNHPKEYKSFNLKICIDNLIEMMEPLLTNNSVKVYNECKAFHLEQFESEMSVAILNILNNSLYELTKNKTHKERYIVIEAQHENGLIEIHIKDTRENIKTDTLLKQFATTGELKNNSETRLFFSNKIIQESMKGELSVNKNTHQFQDKLLPCANFIIKLKACADE